MKTALIVDDELLACELIQNLIAGFRLPIEVAGFAHAGDEALELIMAKRPDLLFLDIQLPVYDGIEIMRRLAQEYVGAIKVIIITAHGYFEYAQQALRLGAKDILLKPVDAAQFIEMIGRVLGTRYTNNQMFNQVLEYVDAHYGDKLTLSGCAARFHTSPNYLARLFMRHTGTTFISYINELRIEKAMELLKQEDGPPVKEVAARVGFNNLNYFYKKFNQVAGVTPGSFRE